MINMVLYLNTAALGEGLLFDARAGLDRATTIDAINDSVVGCTHYRGNAEKLKNQDYSPVSPISLVGKDMDPMLAVGTGSQSVLTDGWCALKPSSMPPHAF